MTPLLITALALAVVALHVVAAVEVLRHWVTAYRAAHDHTTTASRSGSGTSRSR